MNPSIITMINDVADRSRVSRKDLIHAMELALEEAVCAFFGVRECEVNLRFQTVYPAFHVPESMRIEEAELFKKNAVLNDRIYPEFTFAMLHEDIFRHCSKLFERNLQIMHQNNLLTKWKRLRHAVVDGSINSVSDTRITIDLGEDGVQGIMKKRDWVTTEISMYKPGKLLKWYVLKTIRGKDSIRVYLSRGTRNFPARLLADRVPGLSVTTRKRFQGKITWLVSSMWIDPEIIGEIRRELRGEVLNITVKEP